MNRQPGFDPITFTFNENLNYGRERGVKIKHWCDVFKLFVFTSLLTTPSNVFLSQLKHTLTAIIRIFTIFEGDVIKSRLLFKIFSTLTSSGFPIMNFNLCEAHFLPKSLATLTGLLTDLNLNSGRKWVSLKYTKCTITTIA